jgi:hypothetical protein
MKFVVSWRPRFGGSAAENEAGVAQVLEVCSKWTPPSVATFHQFVVRADGEGVRCRGRQRPGRPCPERLQALPIP